MAFTNTRNRTIYQSESLWAGPYPATGQHFSSGNSGTNLITQLQRVQSANHSFNISRLEAQQFGQLSPIDRVIVEAPTVTLDFSYLINDFLNESTLGLIVNGSANTFSQIFSGIQDQRNYFLLETPEGSDAVGGDGQTALNGVHSFGNGFATSFSWEGQVGQFPRATVQVQAYNYQVDIGSANNNIPAINTVNGLPVTGYLYTIPTTTSGVGVSVLRPGDITLNISGSLGYEISDLKLQSFNLQAPINRQALLKLGSKFPFYRAVQFPVNVTLQVDALVGALETDSLANVVCNDQAYNLSITMLLPSCSGNGATAVTFALGGAKLDTQNASVGIPANNTVQFTWLAPLGGPSDFTHYLTLSGILN